MVLVGLDGICVGVLVVAPADPDPATESKGTRTQAYMIT